MKLLLLLSAMALPSAVNAGAETVTPIPIYTQDDIREIVAYAEARFITVVPEIEMPGHSLAILSVLPELKCDPDAKGWVNVFCAGNDKTYEVLRDILEETFALFPSEFVHIGGDEANKGPWKACPKCKARTKREGLRDVHALQSYFIKQMEPVFHKHDKRLLGWDEIMDGGLAPSAAVMYWRSQDGHGGVNERVAEAARKGHSIIMTPQTYCYYDFPQDENWFNEPAGWKGAVTTRKTYAFEPIPEGLPKDKQRNILGAQCNLWRERVSDMKHAEYMLFPRVFALAEVMWSPKSTRDYNSLMQRSLAHLPRLAKRSVNVRYPDGIGFETRNGMTSITPELLVSDGTNESVVAKGAFSGKREQQFVIFPKPTKGRFVTLRVLNAVNGVTTGSEVRLFR